MVNSVRCAQLAQPCPDVVMISWAVHATLALHVFCLARANHGLMVCAGGMRELIDSAIR